MMNSSKDFCLRIAHISDLHFSKPTCSPFQFLSKRWIGNLNLIFSRQKNFETERLKYLVEIFKEHKVDHVVISGDLSTTSLEQEFKEASAFIEQLKAAGMNVFTLPGNHDHYTKKAYKNKLFYHFFDCNYSLEDSPIYSYNLKKHKLAAKYLGNKWWLIVLDTAVATSLVSSRGHFSEELENNLKEALLLIPAGHQIILANHFPFFDQESPRKTLARSGDLRALLQKFPNIKLYLHGHTHRHCLADLRASGLPIISDSGSTSHRVRGAWNLIDISSKGCDFQVFKWHASETESTPHWRPVSQAAFHWNQ
jgi:3',5'-cyclic AMP phosphodiesterase CpdA